MFTVVGITRHVRALAVHIELDIAHKVLNAHEKNIRCTPGSQTRYTWAGLSITGESEGLAMEDDEVETSTDGSVVVA